MKKETIIAVVLGIGLGILVAVGIVIKNRQFEIQKMKAISLTQITPTPFSRNISTETLEITEPQTGAIITTNSVSIKGKVSKGSLIVIQSQLKTQVIKDAPEELSVTFPLALGENSIDIVTYPKDTQLSVKEKQLQVYYLDEQ